MSGYSRMMQALREQYLATFRPVTFTCRDGDKKTTLTLDEVRRLALVGCVVVRHYKRRLPKLGEAALTQRLRKQGFDHATVKEILRLAQVE